MALQETLPELAIVEGNNLVSASSKAAHEATVATESAIINGLQSMFSMVANKVQSEQEALETMLNSFGFGPMFAVI